MPVAEFREPRFEPEADYLQTLHAFQVTFADNPQHVADMNDGVRLLAGNMVSTRSLSEVDGAERLKLVIVETRDGDDINYRYRIDHLNEGGNQVDFPRHGMYRTNYLQKELVVHTERDGERIRDQLEAAQFDLFEALMEASDETHTGNVEGAIRESQIAEAKMQDAARRTRASRWIRFFDWWGRNNPFTGTAE